MWEQLIGILDQSRDGIFAIVGVIVGFWLERLARRLGRVQMLLREWRLIPLGQDQLGGECEVALEVARYAQFMFSLAAFNGKEEPTGFRDFAVVFEQAGAVIATVTPADASTGRVVASQRRFDDVEILNLPSKEWVTLTLRGTVTVTDKLRSATGVFLSYVDAKGKRHRASITNAPTRPIVKK
jgi:hypothetical protein